MTSSEPAALCGTIHYNLILKFKIYIFIVFFFITGQKNCVKKIYHAHFSNNNKKTYEKLNNNILLNIVTQLHIRLYKYINCIKIYNHKNHI
jgi:hypothetical protein